jgi:hypothetical protein
MEGERMSTQQIVQETDAAPPAGSAATVEIKACTGDALSAEGTGARMNASNGRPLANVRELAVLIADRFARSEIEMFCRNVATGKGSVRPPLPADRLGYTGMRMVGSHCPSRSLHRTAK